MRLPDPEKENEIEKHANREKYDRAFKKEAVALWLNSGKSARQIASELGITENRLHLWGGQHLPEGKLGDLYFRA